MWQNSPSHPGEAPWGEKGEREGGEEKGMFFVSVAVSFLFLRVGHKSRKTCPRFFSPSSRSKGGGALPLLYFLPDMNARNIPAGQICRVFGNVSQFFYVRRKRACTQNWILCVCVCVKLTLESRISHHTIIPHLTNPDQFLRLIGASFPQKESSPRFYGTFPLLGRMGGPHFHQVKLAFFVGVMLQFVFFSP